MKHSDHETTEELAQDPRAVALPEIENLVRGLLLKLGEDPERQGLLKTPARVARALAFLTDGYERDITEVVNDAVFDEDYDEIVLVKDINFFSLCEHHLLPFMGRVHVAYLPNKKVIGLSKIPRLVNVFARRLQLQERMTRDIAGAIECILQPRGVGVVCQARHMCMEMRGVEKQNSETVTSTMIGEFRTDPKTREEFLALVQAGKSLR